VIGCLVNSCFADTDHGGTIGQATPFDFVLDGNQLLIVCANVANLMLVRGMARRQQTSLSMALGARPARLIRQVLTESIVLHYSEAQQ
jgi:hypothetical protein